MVQISQAPGKCQSIFILSHKTPNTLNRNNSSIQLCYKKEGNILFLEATLSLQEQNNYIAPQLNLTKMQSAGWKNWKYNIILDFSQDLCLFMISIPNKNAYHELTFAVPLIKKRRRPLKTSHKQTDLMKTEMLIRHFEHKTISCTNRTIHVGYSYTEKRDSLSGNPNCRH